MVCGGWMDSTTTAAGKGQEVQRTAREMESLVVPVLILLAVVVAVILAYRAVRNRNAAHPATAPGGAQAKRRRRWPGLRQTGCPKMNTAGSMR